MNHPIELLQFSGRAKVRFVAQSEASECGLACLAMVAGFHGYETDLINLRHRFAMSLKGATLIDLVKVADFIGLNARALRAEIDELQQFARPAILHWNLNHFVVLAGVAKTRSGLKYRIFDPARGECLMTAEEVSRQWTGVGLELSPSQKFQPKAERNQLGISQLWSKLTGFWGALGQIVILSLVMQVVVLAMPFFLQIAVDTVFPAFDDDLLLMLAIGFAGLAVINLVISWMRELALVRLANGLIYQVVVNLFRHLTRLPLDYFEKRHVGDIVSRFGSTEPVGDLVSRGMIAAFIDGLMAILTLTLMYVYSPSLTVLASAALAAYAVLRVSFLQAIKMRNLDLITAMARENSHFIETVRGISAIKAFGQEANRRRMWQQRKAAAVNAQIKLGQLTAGFDALQTFVISIERVVFVYFAISLAFDSVLTIGMIFAFQAYKQSFLDAGIRLIEQGVNYQVMKVHLTRIADIALTQPESADQDKAWDEPDFAQPIQLDRVSYRYGSNEPMILKTIDLVIQPGEFLAITGPSGGGKTTLMKIIMGLLDPKAGQLRIGSRSMDGLNKEAYRRAVGSVAQGDMLYAGSLAQNIAFFDPEIDMARVREVARQARIHDEIEAFPMGYETLVGDMGSVLSGGQLQRVLLARALYPEPRLLILDEGTANLDPENERLILETIRNLPITRIAVAHRPATLEAADRVIILESGQVRAADLRP